MTTQQQNDLLKIFIASSYIDIDDSIFTHITSANKKYAQLVATILDFENDKNPAVTDLLKTIIIKYGWISSDGSIWSHIPPYNKYYEVLKTLIKEKEVLAQQQKELLNILIRNSKINNNDDTITIRIIFTNKKHFNTLMLLLTNDDKKLCSNNLLEAFLEHCNLGFDGTFWSVVHTYDEYYEEVKKLVKERKSNDK